MGNVVGSPHADIAAHCRVGVSDSETRQVLQPCMQWVFSCTWLQGRGARGRELLDVRLRESWHIGSQSLQAFRMAPSTIESTTVRRVRLERQQ